MSPSLILTLTYFTLFGIYGVITPYLPIILHQQGLGDADVTLAMAANGLAGIFAPLFISHFADRIFAVRHILSGLTVCTVLLSPCWLLVNSLWSAFTIGFVYFSLIIPALSNLDAYTVQYCRKNPTTATGKKQGFQSFRVWGSIGFMVPVLMLLPVSLWHSIDGRILIGISVFLGTLGSIFAFCLPHNAPLESRGVLPSGEAARAALRPPLRGIFLATSIAGLALSIFFSTFPRYLQELGNSTLAIGVIINLGVMWEILLMPWTPRLIEKVGARGIVLWGLASIPIRLFAIAIWPSTTVIILTQFLHAPLVIGLFVSVPIYLGNIAGESYRFSLQSINTTLVMGVSRSIGPCLGALLIYGLDDSTLMELRAVTILAGILGALSFCTLYLNSPITGTETSKRT